MMRIFTLAASIMVLAAISGEASAGATAAKVRHDLRMSANLQIMNAVSSATPAVASNAYRYHGGPKSIY